MGHGLLPDQRGNTPFLHKFFKIVSVLHSLFYTPNHKKKNFSSTVARRIITLKDAWRIFWRMECHSRQKIVHQFFCWNLCVYHFVYKTKLTQSLTRKASPYHLTRWSFTVDVNENSFSEGLGGHLLRWRNHTSEST